MKSRVSLVLVALLLMVGVLSVAADSRPLAVAVTYEQALNVGDVDGLTALFATNAIYVDGIGGEEIAGRQAIVEELASQRRETRSFEIVAASMSANQLTLVVDISDRGITWGRQTLRATVEDGLIQRLEPIAFRFLF